MENVIEIQDGGAGALFMAAMPGDTGTHESGAPAVVPAQPALPELGGYDDVLFDTDWPSFTALWMLGGDSD